MKTNLLFLSLLFLALISNKNIEAMDGNLRPASLDSKQSKQCLCLQVYSLKEVNDTIQVYFSRGCKQKKCEIKGFLIQLPGQRTCMPLQKKCSLTDDPFIAEDFVTIYSCGHCFKSENVITQMCPLPSCLGNDSKILGRVRVPSYDAMKTRRVRLWPGAFNGDIWLKGNMLSEEPSVLQTNEHASDVAINMLNLKGHEFFAILPSGQIKGFSSKNEMLEDDWLKSESEPYLAQECLKERILILRGSDLQEKMNSSIQSKTCLNYMPQSFASFCRQDQDEVDEVGHNFASMGITPFSLQKSPRSTSTESFFYQAGDLGLRNYKHLEPSRRTEATRIPVFKTGRYVQHFSQNDESHQGLWRRLLSANNVVADGCLLNQGENSSSEKENDDCCFMIDEDPYKKTTQTFFVDQFRGCLFLEQNGTVLSSYSKRDNRLISSVPFILNHGYYYAVLPCGHIRIIPDKILVFHDSWIQCEACCSSGKECNKNSVLVGMAERVTLPHQRFIDEDVKSNLLHFFVRRDNWLRRENKSLSDDDYTMISCLDRACVSDRYVSVDATMQRSSSETFKILLNVTYNSSHLNNQALLPLHYSCKGALGQHCIIFPCGHAFVFDEETFVAQSNLYDMQKPCSCLCCGRPCSIFDLAFIRAPDLTQAWNNEENTSLVGYSSDQTLSFEEKATLLYGYLFP